MKTKVRTKMINTRRTYSISRMHSECKFTIPDPLQLDMDLAVLEVNLVVVIILSVINNITSSASQFQLHKQHLAL